MRLVEAVRFEPVGNFEALANRPLAGKPVAVIGGGPGFCPSAHRRLLDYDPILVNNAYALTKEPSLVVAYDHRWYGWHGRTANVMGHTLVAAMRPGQRPQVSCHVFEKDILNAWSGKPHVLPGRNSGHGAVALAMMLGANTVYLAGFDMTFGGPKKERTHWHGGHKIPAALHNYEVRFKPALEELAKIAAHMGIRVVTITPSFADIPTAPMVDALEHLHEAHKKGMDHPPA